MRQVVILNSERNQNHAHRLIDLARTQDGTHELIVRPKEDKRRPLQNRLYHHWITEIKSQHDSIDTAYFESINKIRFGIPVRYRRDDKIYQSIIDHIFNTYTYEEQVDIFKAPTIEVTRNLYVKEMNEVLTQMEFYWTKQGIRLTTSDDLYFEAMRSNRT